MTARFARPIFAFLFPALACIAGCNPRTPAEQENAADKVLETIGVAPPAKQTVEEVVVSDPQTPLAQSIVKQEPKNQPGASGEEAKANPNAQDTSAALESPQAPKLPPKPTTTIDDRSVTSEKWITPEELPRETWEVQYLGNAPVGFLRRKVSVSDLGSDYYRHEAVSRMRVSLKGKPMEQRIRLMTIERDNGALVELECSLEVGPNKQSIKGKVTQDGLKLTGVENGQPFSIDWRKEYRGPFAVYESMLRRPLKSRETRKLKYFDPLLRKIIDGQLEASDYILTPTMLGGTKQLLEVRNIGAIGENGLQSLLWVDEKGESFKSFVQDDDIMSFRTEPIVAQVVESIADLRAIEPVLIPVKGPVERLTNKNVTSMSYRLSHPTADLYRIFKDRTDQRISSIDPRTVEVKVFQDGVKYDPLLDIDFAPKVEPGTKASSEFVPSDTPVIQNLAKRLVAADKTISLDEASNTVKANACRKEIQMRISLKEFDKQIGTVANSLKTKQANCVEHALLFASVCRALAIPSRIAIGVKSNRSTETPAMKFHAWIEIRDDDRWVPMDSTDEVVPTSLDRIKMQDSNFNNANPYLDILSVYRLLPELSIQVPPK